ncbi:MAG: hypothetical protein EOP84_19240 [Verrucomicrobiaceae bacterium]|nr:MAG: hypothetical protein EOP84_19240 [Verrucomicrobiaceae bacterium]
MTQRTKCKDTQALAEKYGVSDRTNREWQSKGYPIDDRAKLWKCLEQQRIQPDWYRREAKRRKFILRERETSEELYGTWGSFLQGGLLIMGRKVDQFPWPFGDGPDLTAKQKQELEGTDNSAAEEAWEEYWRDQIRSDNFTGPKWDNYFSGKSDNPFLDRAGEM